MVQPHVRCSGVLSSVAATCAAALVGVAGPSAVWPGVALSATASETVAPKCATSGLVVWLDTEENGTAGSIYYGLRFTNLSGHRCSLFGYPGVSAVNLGRRQLGSAAGRNPHLTPWTATLANGATASAVLQITEAGNFPPATCSTSTAAGLRVYPPGQTVSKIIPFPFSACSLSGPVYLHVEAVTG